MFKKRTLLKSVLAGGVLCAFPLVRAMQATGGKKLNILFMGGTGFKSGRIWFGTDANTIDYAKVY